MSDAGTLIVIEGRWFPARTSRSLPGRLEVRPGGQAWLHLSEPETAALPLDLRTMAVSARVGDIPRRLSWPDGGTLETGDNDTVDRLMRVISDGREKPSLAHRLESSTGWRFVAAVSVMLVVAAGMMVYGIPVAADGVARVAPQDVVAAADDQAMWAMEELTEPSQASPEDWQRVRRLVDELAVAAGHEGELTVVLRRGGSIGANAFALPAGTIVVTDEMMDLVETEDQLAGVLAHEIAHVEMRHGLRRVARAAAWSVMLTVVLEDMVAIGEMAASVPAVLVDAGYSRGFESEADARAVEIMRAAGRDPWAVAAMLGRLGSDCGEDGCEGGWLSTHPGIDERVEAARRHALPD